MIRIDNPGHIPIFPSEGSEDADAVLLPEDILPADLSEPKPHAEESYQMTATFLALQKAIKQEQS